ncbi:MAG: dihydropteroate synthase, partial [Actinobacteria bacterium]|nr:dihydropteroate synthase [Actinomycetota bacterium]
MPVVMGVLNVTPDSFSDGGRFESQEAAVQHGRAMRTLGADIVDVGGESTRPGAVRVSPEEEIARVVGVVKALARIGTLVSVDTMRAEVAIAAVEAGACLVNDVSGGLADPNMHGTVAALGVPYVVTHWRRTADAMTHTSTYQDCLAEVCAELGAQTEQALDAGIAATRIIVDPGLGFAKDADDNWA